MVTPNTGQSPPRPPRPGDGGCPWPVHGATGSGPPRRVGPLVMLPRSTGTSDDNRRCSYNPVADSAAGCVRHTLFPLSPLPPSAALICNTGMTVGLGEVDLET
jgi:hypothetical protein